ncbi:hypothetical protein C0995_016000 [Termitomyces sp. Mi166|nr:hypothetical protein C0995_016000 [Termitomyces sp. Mi166\
MTTPLPQKSHSSPAKTSYGRTYDSKLVSREMHRLTTALAPPTASASSLALSAPPQPSLAATASSDPWGALHVHVLPLFNGEPLRIPIEDLNLLVNRHIQSVVSSSPSKALSTLENDASDLIASGMVTLNAKLIAIDDEKLIPRVVEIWGFFWDQVLLPLQTDPLLLALYRTPKTHHHRPSSPPRQPTKGTAASTAAVSASHIDVRCVALRSFRDKVILPLSQRMYQRLSIPNRQDTYHQETASYQQPRLQQMLLVLSSQRRPRPLSFSLTAPPPTLTPGEQAIIDLLRVSRCPRPEYDARTNKLLASPVTRAPSFLSGGLPRDRRGRIAQKQNGRPRPPNLVGIGLDEDVFWVETPRGGFVEREKDRELLESLRSPDVDTTVAATRASVGGWGLGEGHEDVGKTADEEDDDIILEQAIVDYMVGPPGRRMT